MEEKPSVESTIYEEQSSNSDHGWQKVSYAKRQRKSQPHRPSLEVDPERSRIGSGSDRSNVFRSIEQQAEERIRQRAVFQESQRAAAEAAAKPKPSAGGSSSDDAFDSDNEAAAGSEIKVEAKKPKQKKPKKPKVTVADAASKIDASNLAAYLADISASFEGDEIVQLKRLADYFARAFSSVNTSQFPWTKIFKESPVDKISDMPLCDIPGPVYRTSVDWISKRSADALAEFIIWSVDGILADLASQKSNAKSTKKSVQHSSSKAQVELFVALAMVLRQKPDILISQLSRLRDDPKYQGQDKLSVHVWVISQACAGDMVVGMYSWVRNLLPIICGKSGSTPQSRDLVLQLVERILSAPKARPILLNGVVRKGERMVPPSALDLLMRFTFPAPSSQIKATERFKAIYPSLKEFALTGSAGAKAMKQVSHQLLPMTVKAMNENIPELSKEAASIFIWCLAQNADCYKQWENLYLENIDASVTVLQTLAGQWKDYSMRLAPLDNLKNSLKSFRVKNGKILTKGADTNSQVHFKDSDKYCEVLLGRLTRSSCMRSGVLVLTLAIAGAFIISPSVDSFDWKNLQVMFSSSVLNIK